MSLKKLKSDVATAAKKVAANGIAGIVSVTNGDSDGEVVIMYRHESLAADVRIQALAQDLGDYPDGNRFLLWTDESDPAPHVVAAIKAAQDYLVGMSVYEMVSELASRLDKEIRRALDGGGESATEAEQGNDEPAQDDDDYDAAYDSDYPSDGDEFGLPTSAPRGSLFGTTPTELNKPLLQRIRRDLRRVKQAGYKVGLLDGFGKDDTRGVVSLSIRIDKLAISSQALEAWDVNPTEYLVLLLCFVKPYQPLDRILNQPVSQTQVKFHVGKCARYKPSINHARRLFADDCSLALASSTARAKHLDSDSDDFQKLFISNSLEQFLRESFVSLLKLRESRGLGWDEANELLRTSIGLCSEDQGLPEPLQGRDSGCSSPVKVSAPEHHGPLGRDHLMENLPASERSFPLIAMQFVTRYFVDCTKYCLRCHRRLKEDFEALRPYVCADGLCLFQYMAMGLGPAIEHEILTEPYVVDLLVSLCYAAAEPHPGSLRPTPMQQSTTPPKLSMRTPPVGLRLRVPHFSNATADPLKAITAAGNTRLVLEEGGARRFDGGLAPGGWLAFRKPGRTVAHHARIQEVFKATRTVIIEVKGHSDTSSAKSWNPVPPPPPNALVATVQPWAPIAQARAATAQAWAAPAQASATPAPACALPDQLGAEEDGIVDVFLYDTDFDALSDVDKGIAIRNILDTLPPILDIEDWLADHPYSSIRDMDRISPAAASLLQWIVSSNRSCIFQVDRSREVAGRWRGQIGASAGTLPPAGRGRNREHERILGMDGWVQFRFAQGSPDKELRFNRALQEVAARKHMKENPTIFAWHGSRLSNWHSILRTGLDYRDVTSGRAFGNGVYFSPRSSISTGYAYMGSQWPNSDLRITSCLSLNEIINAPDEFVSCTPHYVVSQPDWHQCRYLFVQTQSFGPSRPGPQRGQNLPRKQGPLQQSASSQTFYPQPHSHQVYGQSEKPLKIPLSAIPLRTINRTDAVAPGPAKRTVQRLEESDDEDAEEMAILFSDDKLDTAQDPPKKKSASRASSVVTAEVEDIVATGPPTPASIDHLLTDFVPGSLDLSTLPRLAPPSFATDSGTKSLSRELVRLQNIQATTPLHELGWYMDFDQVSNLYQWIVELHSFDASLPLARDMKKSGIGSIVMEVRFGPDFPFSPPFVRVVRPRFLPFMNGGGGHVTAGGAMCMELLTATGWSPANSMESVFLQVRVALCSTDPQPARLDPAVLQMGKARGLRQAGPWMDYGIAEAIEAFIRAANAHGWTVPANLRVTANGV